MKKPFSLKSKNILITGASSGIGRRCSIIFSKLGANVILISRNKENLKKTYQQLESGNHLYFAQDVTEYDKLENIISKSVSRIGKISGFVHSAGIGMTLPIKSLSPIHYEKIFSVNVISAFELAKIISKKKYLNENGSSFIFISSIMGLLGEEGKVAYCSSKGALISASKAMALELSQKKIRVNCILPAVVETEMSEMFFNTISTEAKKDILDMHPLGLGNPDDIAYACVFLLSDASKWVTGTSLIVDGGYSAR